MLPETGLDRGLKHCYTGLLLLQHQRLVGGSSSWTARWHKWVVAEQAIAGRRHRRTDSGGKGKEATVRETRERRVEERAATNNMHTRCNCWGMVSCRSGVSLKWEQHCGEARGAQSGRTGIPKVWSTSQWRGRNRPRGIMDWRRS